MTVSYPLRTKRGSVGRSSPARNSSFWQNEVGAHIRSHEYNLTLIGCSLEPAPTVVADIRSITVKSDKYLFSDVSCMERPLVVTDPSENVVEIIREAGELAADTGSPLTVLTVVTESEYQNDAEVLGAIEAFEGATYGIEPATYAEEVAQTAITDVLSDLDIETEAVGRFVEDESDRADAILEVATGNDCDYIFLMGRRRSPTGKALFGDTAQAVILNFDEYVVTMSE